MVKYKCSQCGTTKELSCDGWRFECSCGGWLETVEKHKHKWNYDYDPNNKKLQQARRETLSRVTKLWRHVYQCSECLNTKEQHDFDRTIPCSCGGTMYVQFTYVGKDEYYANGGQLVKKERSVQPKGNLLKQYRKKNNLTQSELAGELGVSRGFIAQLETGKKSIPDYIKESLLPV